MILSAITLTLFAIYLIDFLINDKRKFELCKKFNGPWRMWIVGNMYLYVNRKPEEALDLTSNLIRKYGTTVRLWVGPMLAFITADPKYFEVVLSSQKILTKSSMYNFLREWLGTGLLLSSGKKWFNRRKAITPTFHFKILEQFIEIFNRQNEIFVEKLKVRGNEQPFDVVPDVALMALDVLSETAMGTQLNAQLNQESEYVKAVKEISYIISTKFVKVWQRIDFLFRLTPSKKRLDKLLKISHDFTTNIIVKRRQALLENDEDYENEDDKNIGAKRKMALLDVLLKSTIDGKPLTNEEIQEEVDTFTFEGHETVTTTISFVLYLLSHHPEIQQKVYEEIQAETGKSLTYNTLQSLKYTESVIKETLRLFPPVPIYSRRIEEDLEIDGKVIPANSNLNLLAYVIHKDPRYFPEPEKFIPEWFDDLKYTVENQYVFVPFSAGPRNCIGQKFAMLEIKSALCNILTNFVLVPSPIEPKLLFQLTLKSQNGVHVGFKKRSAE